AREVRQEVVVAPRAAVAEPSRPAVIILALAAHVDHGVDGAAAAQRLGHRHDRPASAELWLRHRVVHLEEIVAGEVFHVARRHRHQPRGGRRPALDDQHPKAEIADQPHGRNRGGRSAARNDEIVRQSVLPMLSLHIEVLDFYMSPAFAPLSGDGKMVAKIFIDGEAGTTGLQIRDRLAGRRDLEVISIAADKRKDQDERKRLLNAADVAILCLPDDAAKESVSLIDNDRTKVIDASTAHRVAPGWEYGFAEMDKQQGTRI